MSRHTWLYGRALLFGFLLSGVAALAQAQQPTSAQTSAIKQSCRSDYQANCASVPTGGKASLQCLQEHLSDLSPACQTAVSAVSGGGSSHPSTEASQAAPAAGRPPAMSMRQEAALMRQSCGGDFRAYCRGVQPGGGRGLACLADNQSRLSPPCKNALANVQTSR